MEDLVEQQLWNLKQSIEPTQSQNEAAQRSHLYLRELLSTGQIGSRIEGSYLSGSYSRDTAIRPIDDVDIIFLINPLSWNQNSFFSTKPSPAAVLQTFGNAIRYRYPVSSVYHQRRSVRLSLFHLDIDVVPAISESSTSGLIHIPDTENDEWILSSPIAHSEQATIVNKLRSARFKPLVKILKRWNSNIPSTVSLRSFCIETIATRLFTNVPFTSLSDGLLYYWDFASRFANKSELYKWESSYGISWNLLLGLTVPDIAGTNSNTAAGVNYYHASKFGEHAARSRDRLLSARRAYTSDSTTSHLKDALYI